VLEHLQHNHLEGALDHFAAAILGHDIPFVSLRLWRSSRFVKEAR
jgi:hypothetical protein